MPATTAQDLRYLINQLRRKPVSLSNLIPVLQGAADTIDALNRTIERCHQDADMAPIVKVRVLEDRVASCTMYAPGLPEGLHDLYPAAGAAGHSMLDAHAQADAECFRYLCRHDPRFGMPTDWMRYPTLQAAVAAAIEAEKNRAG